MLPAGALAESDRDRLCRQFIRNLDWNEKSFIVSALTGEGCKELTYAIMEYLEHAAPVQDQEPDQTEPGEASAL